MNGLYYLGILSKRKECSAQQSTGNRISNCKECGLTMDIMNNVYNDDDFNKILELLNDGDCEMTVETDLDQAGLRTSTASAKQEQTDCSGTTSM